MEHSQRASGVGGELVGTFLIPSGQDRSCSQGSAPGRTPAGSEVLADFTLEDRSQVTALLVFLKEKASLREPQNAENHLTITFSSSSPGS